MDLLRKRAKVVRFANSIDPGEGLMKLIRFAVAIVAISFTSIAVASEGFDPAAPPNQPKSYDVGGALDLSGLVTYLLNPPAATVQLGFERLDNNTTSGTSGNIIVALIATTTPIVPGQGFSYYIVGRFNLNPLPWNFYYGDVTQTVALTTPPDALYYLHMAVFEQEVGCTSTGTIAGYCSDDVITFDDQRAVIGGVWQPISTTAPTTAAVEYFKPVITALSPQTLPR
jgi:hypothetical protein